MRRKKHNRVVEEHLEYLIKLNGASSEHMGVSWLQRRTTIEHLSKVLGSAVVNLPKYWWKLETKDNES